MSVGAIRMAGAFVEIFGDDRKLQRTLAGAQRRLKTWSANVAAAGRVLAGMGAAGITSLIATTKVFADLGSQIHDIASRTGISTEAISTLAHIASQAGADIQTLEKGIRRMQQAIHDDAMADEFERLGLSIEELRRLGPQEQFIRVLSSLGQVEDDSLQTALAMDILGRAGTGLLQVAELTSDEMRQLAADAVRLGVVMDTQTAAAADNLGDAYGRLGSVIKQLVVNVGAEFAPLMTSLSVTVGNHVGEVVNWIKANKGLILTAGKSIAIVGGIGVTLLGVSAALKLTSFAIGGIGLVVSALTLPFKAITLAIGVANGVLAGFVALKAGIVALSAVTFTLSEIAIGTLAAFLGGLGALASPLGLLGVGLVGVEMKFGLLRRTGREALESIGSAAKEAFAGMKQDGPAAFNAIKSALESGDLANAAKIGFDFVKLEFLRVVLAMREVWNDFASFFTSKFQRLVDGATVATILVTNTFTDEEVGKAQMRAFREMQLNRNTDDGLGALRQQIEDQERAFHLEAAQAINRNNPLLDAVNRRLAVDANSLQLGMLFGGGLSMTPFHGGGGTSTPTVGVFSEDFLPDEIEELSTEIDNLGTRMERSSLNFAGLDSRSAEGINSVLNAINPGRREEQRLQEEANRRLRTIDQNIARIESDRQVLTVRRA